jgi:hypothetical protein
MKKINSRTRTIQRKKPLQVQHRIPSNSSSKWVIVASATIAFLSTSALVASLALNDHSDLNQSDELEADLLAAQQAFEDKEIKFTKEIDLLQSQKIKLTTTLSLAKEANNELSENLKTKERELAQTKDDLARSQTASINSPSPDLFTLPTAPTKQTLVSKSESEKIIDWAKQNSTLVFPVSLNITKSKIILHDREKTAKIPVFPGGKVTAKGFHPTSPEYLIVALPHSRKFMASITIGNSNLVNEIQPLFKKHENRFARK